MALKKEIKNNLGQTADYHRIVGAEINYDLGQLRIYLDSYTSKDYRDIEKKQIHEINANIELYYKLTNDLSVEKRSKEKRDIQSQLAKLNIQELEASKIERTNLKRDVVTVNIEDDLRDLLYSAVKTIPGFEDAEDI